jgi:hypothetical protein
MGERSAQYGAVGKCGIKDPLDEYFADCDCTGSNVHDSLVVFKKVVIGFAYWKDPRTLQC